MANLDIIVVGASAGGVEALKVLVPELPADLPASIFVVVHTGPENGRLANVLSRNGSMRTVRALNGSRILRSHIYVAPPDHHLMLENNHMWLTVGPKVNRHRPAIDPLFESAAGAYGSRVIGVVLTGYLDDGSVGLAAIKGRGGIAVVQDPNDAVVPYMPRNALRLVRPEYCLPLSEIAPLLVRLVTGGNKSKTNRK